MRSRYGAHPAHLVGHLLAFALIAYAIAQLAGIRGSDNVLLWAIGAVLLHDAILWPLYALTDAAGRRALGSAINFVRIPAGLSLLLLLVFVGTITGKGSGNYHYVSTFFYEGYATRWLALTAVLFLVSGAVALWRGQPRGVTR